jgi:hydrogenase small subunit
MKSQDDNTLNGFGDLMDSLKKRGVTRRDFMKFCTAMAAVLALPSSFVPKIAEAVATKKKPYLVWLEFQDCAGDTEALLRATKPTVGSIVLDVLSVDYHETIMAPSGHQAEKSLQDVVKNNKGAYFTVVEGSIPAGDGGVYCCVSGRSALDIAQEVCGNALATIAVGTCATSGGIPRALPNPTGALSVKEAVPNATVINIPGCPLNVENLTATIVHYLTFNALPNTDKLGRPLFAFGKRIHDNCERRGHFDAGQFVRQWGDEGHSPTVKYNEGTSWPIQGGHGCIGCSEPHFWDTMSPFYRRLPKVPGFGVESTADKVGAGLAAATAAGVLIHGIGRAISPKKKEEEGGE